MKKNNLKVHSLLPEEIKPLVIEIAEDLGLSKINYDEFYNIYKVGDKSNPVYQYKELVLRHGSPRLIGDGKQVAIYLSNYKGDWFKTSAIVEFYKTTKVYKITTLNSFYELEMVK